MKLPWREVNLGLGPIRTSLTSAETARLRQLAAGKRVLEVGTGYGYSAIAMALADAIVITVDPHTWITDSHPSCKKNLRIYGVDNRVTMRTGYSADVCRELLLSGERFDLAFIDGDHSYEAVSRGLDLAWPLLVTGGWLAVHDYLEETCAGVRVAVDERFPDSVARIDDTLWTRQKRPEPRVSVIVASSGRPTLTRTIQSIHPQLAPGDEILVSINQDCPWGHAARNQLMPAARGDFWLFMDDDDHYTAGALQVVRSAVACAPERMHIFRMRYRSGDVLWRHRALACGNVSTQMVAMPRKILTATHGSAPPQWGAHYAGDYDFIAAAARMLGEPVWHADVIALYAPDD